VHPVAEFVPALVEKSVLEEVEARTDEPSLLRGIPNRDNQVYDYHHDYSFGDRDLSIGGLHLFRFRLHILGFLNCHCCYFRFHFHVFFHGVSQYLMARDEDVMDL
jgi:hypothetical protein